MSGEPKAAAHNRGAASFHDALADTWEEKYAHANFAARKSAFARLLDECPVDGVWLDVGCGTGTLTRLLAERGSRALGLDPAPKMLQQARCVAAKDTRFAQVATAEDLPIRSSSVDGIVCSSVLEYVDEPIRCLGEFRRVLKPGGVLLISVPNARSWLRIALRTTFAVTGIFGRPRPEWLKYSRHQYSEAAFRALLSAAGFLVTHAMHFGAANGSRGSSQGGGSLILYKAQRKG